MKKRIEKLEIQKRGSQKGVVIINSSEWQAIWGDEAQPGDEFITEWEENIADKIIIVDNIPEALQAKPGGPGAKPCDCSTGKPCK